MKVFHCDHCDNLVFFENVVCVKCNHALAYLPDLGVVASLDPVEGEPGLWTTPVKRAKGKAYKLCGNYTAHNVCNWALPADDPEALCPACQLTTVIPDLDTKGHKEAWYRLEIAKRRLVYTLTGLGLPVVSKADDPAGGLAFELKADSPPGTKDAEPVLTGHADGLITINVAEADDAEREKRRVQMHEPYRTLLGHYRHEVGHYYWDVLIRDNPKRLAAFRELFGDDRQDYGEALERHYKSGPAADWPDQFVTSYASVHPWEDWAETWAHYLHMTDTLETAADCGLTLRPDRADEPAIKKVPDPVADDTPFRRLMASWYPLTYVLNNLNRGLGLQDGYPFVLPAAAVEKLRFVHDTIAAAAGSATSKTA